MRDATGAAWIFGICLTFIVLFTCYLAISINYAKAFKIKNYIISTIEEHEGYEPGLRERLEAYLANEGYDANGVCQPYILDQGEETEWALDECLGDAAPQGKCSICLYKKYADNQKNADIRAPRTYYRVVAFFRFDLPVIRSYFPSFQVGGDSRYIYDFASTE